MKSTCPAIIVSLLLVFSSPVCLAEWYQESQHVMGTQAHVELWSNDQLQAGDAIKAVMAELQRIDQLMSPSIETSDLYRINHSAANEPVVLSSELYTLIDKSLFYSRLSEGAFDITFSSLGRFYDYPEKRQPSEQAHRLYRDKINYRNIKLDPDTRSIRFLEQGVAIDLGGIAKGHAIDRAVMILKRMGIDNALISAGGDSRIIGNRQGRPWVIGIQNPRDKSLQSLRIPLESTAISTSGDYERYFMVGDKRIHHIIDPRSGYSVGHVQSVSILAPNAVDSDALSTTVFILGVKRGLALINRFKGIDAIIIDDKGLLHYSDDLLMPTIQPKPSP